MNDGEGPPQTLTFNLMMGMAVTDLGQGLLPVNLSRVMKTTTMSAEIEDRLTKAWETM